jgi:hypothetical protein
MFHGIDWISVSFASQHSRDSRAFVEHYRVDCESIFGYCAPVTRRSARTSCLSSYLAYLPIISNYVKYARNTLSPNILHGMIIMSSPATSSSS